MYDFRNRIVVITGAANGIGACMAERFLKEDAEAVILIDLKKDITEAKAKALDPSGERTMAVSCNVADIKSVKKAFESIMERYGRVDIMINNAGITNDAMAHKMTPEQFDTVLKVSLYGSYNCISQVICGMRERGYGRIISMSSLASRGNIGQMNYSAAKAALIGLTSTLALENAANGITVNCIAPGMIATDIIKTIPEKVKEIQYKAIPMKRLGKPEEVASLAAFISSDEAAYISGQCIRITGGAF